ncbi:MAG: NYN domain-containing protein [Thermoanaerobaculia bacterium]
MRGRRKAASAFSGIFLFVPKLRANVYVDGFNLYYRALRQTRCNWLDLNALANLYLPQYDVRVIKYFTAIVDPSPWDPDQQARQLTYIRALGTLPNVEIYRGSFLTRPKNAPCAENWNKGVYKPLQVIKTEEKGSDVNLATHLLCDGFRDRFDIAAVISSDTDLEEPLRVVKEELNKGVVLLHPSKYASRNLAKYATAIRRIRAGALRHAQFPDELTDATGSFRKPPSW